MIKYVVLVNLSTTTKIESCFLKVRGRPNTKFKLRCSYGEKGIGKGVYRPVFCFLPLVIRQIRQWDITLATSHLTSAKKMVLSRPKCLATPFACFFQIKWSHREVLEIHKRLALKKKPTTMVKPSTKVGGSWVKKINRFYQILTSRILKNEALKSYHLCTRGLQGANSPTQSIDDLVFNTSAVFKNKRVILKRLNPLVVSVSYFSSWIKVTKGLMVGL